MLLNEPAEGTSPRVMKEGDLAIVYENIYSMKAVYLDPSSYYNSKHGNFKLRDWIGKPYGSKMWSHGPQGGWVWVLAPTPELWTLVLKHRTQILYVADISLVCSYLELKPGCVVLESGTGSGSLTHALARAVAPTGHVHTFEFHDQRATAAEQEFALHRLGGLISVAVRNIEEAGFPTHLAGAADALFLDLPAPWKVVPSAAESLRDNGKFCSFSPCIEQVQRTCLALDANGFTDITTIECLLRTYEVSTEKVRTEVGTTTGAGKQDPSAAGDADASLPDHVAAAASTGDKRAAGGDATGDRAAKRPRDAAAEDAEMAAVEDAPEAAAAAAAATMNTLAPAAPATGAGQPEAAAPSAGLKALGKAPKQPAHGDAQAGAGVTTVVMCRPQVDARGHTGYLTFARKFVRLGAQQRADTSNGAIPEAGVTP